MNTKINDETLQRGELYCFGVGDDAISTRLWGIFDSRDRSGSIHLAVASADMRHFEYWMPLPMSYTRCRLSSRRELRDFSLNLGRNAAEAFRVPAEAEE